jgi:hypothetical protein
MSGSAWKPSVPSAVVPVPEYITEEDIHAADSKTPPVDADEIPLLDSAETFSLKKLTWANLKAAILGLFSPTTGAGLVGFIQSGTGAVARTVQDKLRETVAVSPKDYSAVGDGVANEVTPFTNANTAGSSIVVPPGTYLLSSNVTFTKPVEMLPGALLSIPTGVTIAFNGGFKAGVWQTFSCSGTGKVTFAESKTSYGYAEWWGAISDDGSAGTQTINTAAINASLVALQKVELMPADYFHDGTINHWTPGVEFNGAGSRYDSVYGPKPTRLLYTQASGTCLQIGPIVNPGTINSFPRGIKTSGIFVARTVAPSVSSASPTVSMKYVLEAEARDMAAAESIKTWQFVGTVGCRVIDSTAIRSVAGTGGTDSWLGFYVDGLTDVIAAGGNASLYLVRCSASCNISSLQTGNSTGFYLGGAFTDAFLIWPETVHCYNGIQVIGNSGTGNTFTNTDLHIDHPVLDQFHNAGIYLSNIAEAGSVAITEPYFGPASDSRASLWFSSCPGGGSVAGGQFVHGGAPNSQPIIISSSSGVVIDGPQILEAGATYSVVGLSNANNCVIKPKIKNKSVTAAAAVQLSGTCTANKIEPVVMGKSNAFTYGIQVVGTADDRNEYACSIIDSACLNGGSGYKLHRNGVSITATGLSGTNLVSGVMT